MNDKQHFLPATYLGGFSSSKAIPRRNRQIFVGDKQTGNIFAKRAGQVAVIRNLYPNFIDKVWSKYEARLADAIDKLILKRIDGETWISTLVPFVACLFIRGPDFSERFNSRFPPSFDDYLTENNTDLARLFELQRLLTSVLAAKWIVFEKRGRGNVITSDIGFAPFLGGSTSEVGIAIPMDCNHILALVFKRQRDIAVAEDGKWIPKIEYRTLNSDNHQGFNTSVASLGQRWIYGSDEVAVKKYLQVQVNPPRVPDIMEFGALASGEARAHELSWHYLASILLKPPRSDNDYDFVIDWETLSLSWLSLPFLSPTLPYFPPAFHISDNILKIDLYDPEPYYNEMDAQSALRAKDFQKVIAESTKALDKSFQARQIVRLYSMRGEAFYDLGQFTNAVDDFRTALKHDPQNASAYMNLCITYSHLHQFPDAINCGNKAIQLDPQFAAAYSNRGMVHSMIEKHEKAITDFDIALKLSKTHSIKAKVHLNRANSLRTLGEFKRAIMDYNFAIDSLESNNESASAYLGRGICYLMIGENEDLALNDTNNAILQDQSLFEAYLLKAQLLTRQNKIHAASDVLSSAIDITSQDLQLAEAYNQRGICLTKTGNIRKGIQDFTRAIHYKPSASQYFFNRGLNYFYKQDLEAATHDFDNAIQINPQYAEAYNARGGILLNLEKYKCAIADFDLAVKCWDTSAERVRAFRNKAICLIELKELYKAQKLLAKVMELDPDHPFSVHVKKQLADALDQTLED